MIDAFNLSQTEYRVVYDIYDTALDLNTKGTGLSEFERDLIDGNLYDLYFFGLNPYEDVNAAEVYASLCEKNIFTDLTAFSEGVDILSSVKKAFRSGGSLPSLPFCAWYELLYSPIGHEQVFSLENLLKIADSLAPEERFLYSAYDFSIVREAGICRFYDAENKTCSFDSPEFLTFLACMDRLEERSADADTDLSAWEAVPGGMQYCGLLEASNTEGLIRFFFSMKDTPFAYAGFLMTEHGAGVRSDIVCAVPKKAACPYGAEALLAFLYSDEIQTCGSLRQYGLPVTMESLKAVFPCGYHYFSDSIFGLVYEKSSAVPLTSSGIRTEFALEYRITEEQRDEFLGFLGNADLIRAADETVLSVVREELTAADAGVRSRAEAAKIIQNRVMLYLNE